MYADDKTHVYTHTHTRAKEFADVIRIRVQVADGQALLDRQK